MSEEFTDLRSQVLDAQARADDSGEALARMAADGLMMIYDRMVPAGMRLGVRSQVTLTVEPEREMHGLRYARTVEHFVRAVASIGLEILEPGVQRALTSADYARARVHPSSPPSGPVVLTADVTGTLMSGTPAGGRTVAQMAMERLVNILPADARDAGALDRVASSRVGTARAVREVAEAAKSLGGVAVTLSADGEAVLGQVDEDQARQFIELGNSVRDDVRPPYDVVAIWDGTRFSRREFFLRFESGRADIEGLVDEHLVELVRGLPEGQVVATIQDVRRVYGDGRVGRPAHHLVAIRPADMLDLDQ